MGRPTATLGVPLVIIHHPQWVARELDGGVWRPWKYPSHHSYAPTNYDRLNYVVRLILARRSQEGLLWGYCGVPTAVTSTLICM